MLLRPQLALNLIDAVVNAVDRHGNFCLLQQLAFFACAAIPCCIS